jgi:2-methylcitrate dehydratase PrpD
MCELSIRQASKPKPPNLNAAMGSTEFSVSLALEKGRNGLREYWDGFGNQKIHEAASMRTSLISEAAYGLTGRQAAIELTLKNGKVLRREQPEPKGEPSNPLTDQELTDKFRGLVQMVKGSQDLGVRLSDALMNLEIQPSIQDMIASLKISDKLPELADAN